MKKSERKLLGETLDKALQPPIRRKPALATHLAEYDKDEPKPRIDVAPPKGESPHLTPPNPPLPISPAKNFNKRANSLDQLALPAGVFPGSSKKLYDALYLKTRGAINPKRSIRATKRELSDWSGIRNVKTIDAHLRYFSAIGLVISEWERGQNEGSMYEVLLPEETSGLFVARSRGVTPPNPMSPPVSPPNGELGQKMELPPTQNLGSPHLSQVADLSNTYSNTNTSLKTTTKNDDEAFGNLYEKLKSLTEKITGKSPSASDRERWGEVADTLIEEFNKAAAHTKTISSVPAFLNAHLQRRFANVTREKTAVKKDEVGKTGAVEPIVPRSMSDDERREVTQMVIEMILAGGYTLEQAKAQFGTGLREEDWHQIQEKVEGQGS